MKILIVDDEPLARVELRYLLEVYDQELVIEEADGIASSLALLVQQGYDVLFLDIHLTDESGMALAEMVNKMPNPPVIIFATAYDQYALPAFEQNARDYLLKPYEFERLAQAMDKVKGESELRGTGQASPEQLYATSHPIEDDGRIHMVATDHILMVEAQQGKSLVLTKGRRYESSDPLLVWEERLDPNAFMRTHRAYLVQLEKIETIEPWFNQTLQLHLKGGYKAPVSRNHVKSLKQRLGI
ncbi:LytR/AlgR family response regulator transcription factor [Streptococcus merionis]|uniref:LytR/AlgR family response regulator transcription factor n=1 Tax=Streptococcus merionis TaxID=400065 RepID=UPI003518D658